MSGFVMKICKQTSTDEIFKKHLIESDEEGKISNLVQFTVKGIKDKTGNYQKEKPNEETKEHKKLDRAKNKLIYKTKI
jgi:hypothetical protein